MNHVNITLKRNMSLMIPGLESVIICAHLHVFVRTNLLSLPKEKQGPYLQDMTELGSKSGSIHL